MPYRTMTDVNTVAPRASTLHCIPQFLRGLYGGHVAEKPVQRMSGDLSTTHNYEDLWSSDCEKVWRPKPLPMERKPTQDHAGQPTAASVLGRQNSKDLRRRSASGD